QTYNPDGDEVLDFIVLVMRALSAQAAANVTAKKAGALVDPVSFIKVGGAAFLPYDAGFSTGVVITLPVHSSAAGSLELFRFIDATTSGRLTAEDIGDHTGEWEYVQDVSLEANSTVIFSANTFGQYCIATSETIHDSGEGGSTE
ncbi:hypothetical protein IIA79_07940, partial [bacterium]|nr:hypothetical protein [bacterium]